MKALQPTPENIALCGAHLRSGGVIGLPTETVYGLAAEASSSAGVALIFKTKGRPSNHPLIVHVAGLAQATLWFDQDSENAQLAASAMAAFWPGPLTLIVKRKGGAPNFSCGDQNTIGLRCPSHPVALDLLGHMMEQGSWGLAAPSANRFGRISPTCAGHVIDDLADDCPLVLDGGDCTIGIESTILDCSTSRIRILRPGSITRLMLESILGCHVEDGPVLTDSQTPRVSGSLDSHYAPSTPAQLVPPQGLHVAIRDCIDAKLRVGVLARMPCPAAFKGSPSIVWLIADSAADQYAQGLYANLRSLDCQGLDRLLIEAPPQEPDWAGVADRVKRSTA